MQVNPRELYALRKPAFLVTKKKSVKKNDNILLYLSILEFAPKFQEWLVLASCMGNE